MNAETKSVATTERTMAGRGGIYPERKAYSGAAPRFKEVHNHFTNEVVKFPISSKVITFSDIASQTAKATNNRRKLENVDLTKHELYKLLKEQRVITDAAIGYTIGDDPIIYLIDGWTRRNIILELAKNEDLEINLPVDVMRLKETDLWVVTALVQQSNTNTPHNPFEKSDMFMDFYEHYAKANPEASTRLLHSHVGTSTLKSPSYSRFKSMLFYSALAQILEKQDIKVLHKIQSMNDANKIMSWLSKNGTDITISEDNKCVQNLSEHIINQIMPLLDDIVLKLHEAKSCTEAFEMASTNEPQSRSTIEIDSKSCSINYMVSRSDVTQEAMKKIVSLFELKKAELEEFMKEIDSIIEEDVKMSRSNRP